MARQIFVERKILYSVITCLIICGLIYSMNPIIHQAVTTSQPTGLEQELQVEETKIVEAEPIFFASADGNDFVDSIYSSDLGYHNPSLPSGMGTNDDSYSTLQEQTYGKHTLISQYNFASKPSGWTDNGYITYSPSSYKFSNDGIGSTAYLYCPARDTSSYNKIEFYLDISVYDGFGGSYSVKAQFYDSSGHWDDIGSSYPSGSHSDYCKSTTDSQYFHSNFRVRVIYSGYNGESGAFLAKDWRIYGIETDWGSGFEKTYRFTNIDYDTYDIEELCVDFHSDSPGSEYLTFRFEAGDTTPDNIVAYHITDDFTVDIHDYLTGPTCYMEIRDYSQVQDTIRDTWYISRVYIKLTNSDPVNDKSPTCSNMDDGDNLYARNKYYSISTSHTNAEGYSQFTSVYLTCYSNDRTSNYWSVRYNEDSNTFSEYSDSSNYIDLDSGSCGYSKSGNNLDLTFKIMINWNHPDINTIDLRLVAYDSDGGLDSDYYEVNWEIETRLDLSSFGLDDGEGTPDRGEASKILDALGVVKYYNSANNLHPSADEIDIFVMSLPVSTYPWADSSYSDIDGSFTVAVSADNEYGLYDYDFIVVAEGADFEDVNLLHDVHSKSYITDRVVVKSIYTNKSDNYFNVGEAVAIYAWLQYQYDNTNVTDGIVSMSASSHASYLGDGIWYDVYPALSEPFSGMLGVSGYFYGEHGLSSFDTNGAVIQITWDQLIVTDYIVSDNRINVGSSVDIGVELRYELDNTLLTSGSVSINGYSAIFSSGYWYISASQSTVVGYTYNTVTALEPEHGLYVVNQNSQSTTVIWDRIIVYDQYSDEPDNRANYNSLIEFYHNLRYEYDNTSVTSGTVTVLLDDRPTNILIHQGDGLWYFQLNCVNPATRVIHSISYSGGPYGITLVNQNDKSLTAIYDGIEIYDFGSDSYPLVNQEFSIWLKARSVIDGHSFGAEDTIVMDDETATWNGTHFIITRIFTEPGDKVFFVNSSLESTYHITRRYIDPSLTVHVSTVPTISDVLSDFSPTDLLYEGNLGSNPLWIQWDPVNDPTPPDFDFIISGYYITTWSITSSWSSGVVDSGSNSGSFNYRIESGLDYTLDNHTYTIEVTTEGGYSNVYTIYVTVRDYTVPAISSPTDGGYEFGATGNTIIWSLNDVHPNLYDVVGNGTDDNLSFDYLWSNGILTISTDGLSPGVYNFTIVLIDEYYNQNSDTVFVTVVDTTSPNWVDEPQDVSIEYGESYTFNANSTDLSDIIGYWINDTDSFNVDSEGIITNLDILEVGLYHLELQCYDAYGNMLSTSFTITVSDSIIPIWINEPVDEIIEYGEIYSFDSEAFDLSGIVSYWINDTTHFSNYSSGLIDSNTVLEVGSYGLEIRGYDPYEQYCLATITIEIIDTTDPTWTVEPNNDTIEYGEIYSFNSEAYDLSGINSYWINDTTLFTITNDGLIESKNTLDVESYGLEIRAYDSYGHYCVAIITIEVNDTTTPTWSVEPIDEILQYGEVYSFYSVASDLSGIDAYWVNDSSLFSIDNSGFIESLDFLDVGSYGLEIRAYDPYNQYCSSIITIEVIDTAPPTWTAMPDDFTAELNITLSEMYGATDLSGLDSWWLNDTINFQISSNGDLENASYLSVGVYYLEISVNDTYGNTLSKDIVISVVDTEAPTWIDEPYSFSSEYGIPLLMEYSAVDPSGIDTYFVNDTLHFQIVDGTLTNATQLDIDTYYLLIYVNDTVGNEMYTSVTVTISEGVGPTWVVAPTDQVVEFGQELSGYFEAQDVDDIASWSTNNSNFFSIVNGHLTNATTLDVGEYRIIIEVADIYNHITSEIISIICEDTTGPDWLETPENIILELGSDFRYDLNASDLSGVDYYVIGDHINFQIDASGVITNARILDIDTYYISVIAYDVYGNDATVSFELTVIDTTSPEWIFEPTDENVELGTEYTFNSEATDLDGIDSYWINDTTHFSIDADGLLNSDGALDIGMYSLEVRAYDSSDNYCTVSISIIVVDTTAPDWGSTPTNQTVELGYSFLYDLNATDLSGIDSWDVDNILFRIDQDGVLQNRSVLTLGIHDVTISVSDSEGNVQSVSITVTVVDTTPPVISNPDDFTISVENAESNITWFVSDLSSGIYEITKEGIVIESGNWYSNNNSIVYLIEEPEVGVWVYEITITDQGGNSVSDSVSVTVEDVTTPPTSTSDTTEITVILPGSTLVIIIVVISTGSGLIVMIIIISRRRV
ncbi:MAG: hypothetical protein GF411_19175 [Candidatus Lokiarchaeota archaeon]|nr:hypothetical protein [Candidatus Lokiarchaeota archaeon]